MEWTRHKGGVHRAEDGTIVRRLDADTFALWRPGASIDDEPLAAFDTLAAARAHAEDGELTSVAAAPEATSLLPIRGGHNTGFLESRERYLKGIDGFLAGSGFPPRD